MTDADLKIGQWYRIQHTSTKALDSYNGLAQFVGIDPPGYPPGSLDFLCEDGVGGVFPIHSVLREEKPKSKQADVRTALTEAMSQMYAMNHDKHVEFVLGKLKPYLKDPVE